MSSLFNCIMTFWQDLGSISLWLTMLDIWAYVQPHHAPTINIRTPDLNARLCKADQHISKRLPQ